jgi:hypothetical protein
VNAPVIEIPNFLSAFGWVSEYPLWKIRAFQMLGPWRIEAVNAFVHDLQSIYLIVQKFFSNNDDEVHITVAVEITYRERALEIGPNKTSA